MHLNNRCPLYKVFIMLFTKTKDLNQIQFLCKNQMKEELVHGPLENQYLCLEKQACRAYTVFTPSWFLKKNWTLQMNPIVRISLSIMSDP